LVAAGGREAVFLRTCYDPELEDVYKGLRASAFYNFNSGGPLSEGLDLDDEALYGGLGGDWTKILLRVPSIVDVSQDSVLENYGDHYPVDWKWKDPEYAKEPEEEFKKAFHRAEMKIVAMVCLVDEPALRENVVKLMFLDRHGNCVWDNKMGGESFQSYVHCAYGLGEYIFDDEPAEYQRGRRLSM
jgi:hypothetical protein